MWLCACVPVWQNLLAAMSADVAASQPTSPFYYPGLGCVFSGLTTSYTTTSSPAVSCVDQSACVNLLYWDGGCTTGEGPGAGLNSASAR